MSSRSREPAADGTRVYIGGLGSGGSKPELEKEFERYGALKSVWVARNPPGEDLNFNCVSFVKLSLCVCWGSLLLGDL